MNTVAVIGLGVLAWVLLATLLALFLGRMIQLRDRQRPDRTEPGASEEPTRAASSQARVGSKPPD
ncbi:MAG: hypothetical protein ABR608_04835 [Pseudonocardiaceae bacterium]